jgi:hypothetical protein
MTQQAEIADTHHANRHRLIHCTRDVLLRLASSGETTRQTKVVKKLPIYQGVHGEFAAMKAEY